MDKNQLEGLKKILLKYNIINQDTWSINISIKQKVKIF
jgi:hypothetical protein